MMKKEVILGILILCLGIFLPMIFAQEDITQTTGELSEQQKVEKALTCLQGLTTDCNKLTTEEKIFTLLSLKTCKAEVIADADVNVTSGNPICWPKGNCNLKTTSQAVLALSKAGGVTTEAEAWILSKRISPPIKWYLQIDSTSANPVDCSINYYTTGTQESTVSVTINADKTITKGATGDVRNCLTPSPSSSPYWLEISSACYDKEFRISCNPDGGSFLTTLFFKEDAFSSTIHILDEVNVNSGGSTTIEQINSFCFGSTLSSCNYEGSLWASIVLQYLGHKVSSYLPYLITMADAPINDKYLPSSFLFTLTSDQEFFNQLMQKQIGGKYWSISGDKIYGTATAFLSLASQDFNEKVETKKWILSPPQQQESGCFGGVRNTAFILASVWSNILPPSVPVNSTGTGEDVSCISAGLFCMLPMDCVGNVVEKYSCSGSLTQKCCDTQKPLGTCLSQGGDLCNSKQICAGGTGITASDLSYGEVCCSGGTCQAPAENVITSECETNGGVCRAAGCETGEEEALYDCSFQDKCCVGQTTTTTEKKSYWWIWVLLVLIVLVILAIIFREKLRPIYMRIKDSIFKKKEGPRPPFGGRPGFAGAPAFTPRPMPPRLGPPPVRPGQRPPGQVNDVLNRLKEMGK